jgi:CRISPR-associated endonuclease/helicase Cas3
MTERLGLAEPEAAAVTLAARWHDIGKARKVWQRSIGNIRYPDLVLAKSSGSLRPLTLSGYRHEFGSLADVRANTEFLALAPDVQELLAHLIAGHHGRARPYFTADESFDPERAESATQCITEATPGRFARLQRTYGRWGLAYLESLVRASDALASRGDELEPALPPADGRGGRDDS